MPYVNRNTNLDIVGLFVRPQIEGQEFLSDTDQEIIDFINPPKNWGDVRELQNTLIDSVMWRIARYQTQVTLGVTTSETGIIFTALLQHCEDVRRNDEAAHATAQEAYDVLEALSAV